MKIYSFTRPELDYFELECNFTSDELKLFRLRAKAMPLEDCAEEMNVSVSRSVRHAFIYGDGFRFCRRT